MNKTKVTRFLLAVILLVVVAFGVMACVDNTPDDNTDETTYKIEVTCDTDQGSYKLDPAKDAYKKGDEVKLTVTPKSEYELDKVTIDGKTATANNNGSYTITVGEANVKVNITFKTKGDVPPAPSTYEVTVNCDKAKATVTFDEEGPYEEGKKVTFTVSTIGENKIKSVKFNGTELEADEDDKYTITITKDKNVIDVEFETSEEPPVKTTYTVNLEYEEAQGSVTLSPSAQDNKYEEGVEVTIEIKPNENYEIDTVKANDSEITVSDGVYKFIVRGKTTVKVTFKEKKVEPPAPAGPEGGLWTNEGTGTKDDPYIIKELNGTIKFHHVSAATKPWFKLQSFEYDTEYKIVSATSSDSSNPKGGERVQFFKNGSFNLGYIGPKGNEKEDPESITFVKENGDELKNEVVVGESDNILFTVNNNSLQECDVTWVFEKVEKEPATAGPEGGLWTGTGTGTKTDPYIIKELNGTIKFHHVSAATKPWFKLQSFEYETEYKIVSADPKGGERVQFFKNGSFNLGYIGPKGNEKEDPESITFVKENGDELKNQVVIGESDYILFAVNNNSLQECDVTWVFEKVEKAPEPSGNLIVSGKGTADEPYILSGMEGTATFSATTGASINAGVQFKVTAAPGKYKFTSDIKMNMYLYKDSYSASTANRIASLTSDPTWLANPAYSDTFEINEQTVLIFYLSTRIAKAEANFTLTKVNGTGGEPGEELNIPDKFHGTWTGNNQGTPVKAVIEQKSFVFYENDKPVADKFEVTVNEDDLTFKYLWNGNLPQTYILHINGDKLEYYMNSVGKDPLATLTKEGEEPAPSGNLIVSGTGTQTDPYILSGMEGTATFSATTGASINAGVQFKVTAAPGKYKFTSDIKMNMYLYKDSYSASTANRIASLTSDPTWLANPAYSDTFEINEQTVLIFYLSTRIAKAEANFTLAKTGDVGGGVNPSPSENQFPEKFQGEWENSTYRVVITKDSLEFYYKSRGNESKIEISELSISEDKVSFQYTMAYFTYQAELTITSDGKMSYKEWDVDEGEASAVPETLTK